MAGKALNYLPAKEKRLVESQKWQTNDKKTCICLPVKEKSYNKFMSYNMFVSYNSKILERLLMMAAAMVGLFME